MVPLRLDTLFVETTQLLARACGQKIYYEEEKHDDPNYDVK